MLEWTAHGHVMFSLPLALIWQLPRYQVSRVSLEKTEEEEEQQPIEEQEDE